jgi:hypothetical protein
VGGSYTLWPSWLAKPHRKLDQVVFAVYGWSSLLTDADVLERVLAATKPALRSIEDVGGGDEAVAVGAVRRGGDSSGWEVGDMSKELNNCGARHGIPTPLAGE